MGLKHFYIKCSLEILDVVANQTALANALSDEEPARDLSDNNGVHSDLLHGGLEPDNTFVNSMRFHPNFGVNSQT